MEEEKPNEDIYREPEFSEAIWNRKPDEKYGKWNYIIYLKGLIYLLLVVLLLLRSLMKQDTVGIVFSLFFLVFLLIIIAGLRIYNLNCFVSLEITDHHIKLPPGLSLRYLRGEAVVVRKEEITKIYPWREEGVVTGVHIVVAGKRLSYKKFYPCPKEDEVREIIEVTLKELKRRFPEQYWMSLGKKE